MQITIERLGRLQHATFDLNKDLIVFVGPNNTSKTYAAYLIYGLCAKPLPLPTRLANDSNALLSLLGLTSSPRPTTVDLGGVIDNSVPQLLAERLAEYGNDLVKDIFSGTADLFRGARVQVVPDRDGLARMRAWVQRHSWSYRVKDGTKRKIKAAGSLTLDFHDDGSPEIAMFLSDMVSTVFPRAAILPAERSAIQLFSRELLLSRSESFESSLLHGEAAEPPPRSTAPYARSMAELARSIPRYPLPIRDTLKVVGDLATLRSRSSPFAHLAEWIERQILQGAVRLAEDGQLTYVPEGSQTSLELHLASSSVKSLSLLTFYLRHLLEPGDLLIIDEPELNLHPDNQRLVARLLARLSRAGVRVLLSTHSDYIVRELNNLIMLSQDHDGALRAELGYDEAEALAPERVGVYLFSPTSAESVPVDQTGFAARTIDQEINRMNNSSERIYLTLFGGASGGNDRAARGAQRPGAARPHR